MLSRSNIAAGLLIFVSVAPAMAADTPPAVGDKAAEFTLPTLAGDEVRLGDLRKAGPVVLVVLRGYPGYQCPLCSVQVGDFLTKSKELAAKKASVVFVYPGPAEKLKEHAAEFLGKSADERPLPKGFHLVLDPDFAFTTAYALRWDAKNETAYPSTFVVDAAGILRFAKISHSHGDRAKAAAVLEALP